MPRYDGYKNYRRGENLKRKWHCKRCRSNAGCAGFSEEIWVCDYPPGKIPKGNPWYAPIAGHHEINNEYKTDYLGRQAAYYFLYDTPLYGWTIWTGRYREKLVRWVHR